MATQELSFDQEVTLQQAARIILATPENRYMLRGEPGIGKSSLMAALAKALPDHEHAMLDVPNLDLGDVAMPVVDHDNGVTKYYPNSRFGLHTGKPVVICLDEFTKGAAPVCAMLHPLLEVHNPRLGDISVPEGSIIFMTGNLSTDGVGDNLKAHTRNRITELRIAKPTADEWLRWAAGNDIDPAMMAFVHQYPHVMASYTDEGQKDNPYIYNPRVAGQTAYFSPRSGERASNILKQRHAINDESVVTHALCGTIGEAAAKDLAAFIAYQDELPAVATIESDPLNAKIPDGAGATAVLVYGLVERVTAENCDAVMAYISRLPDSEWQCAFCIAFAKNPKKQQLAFKSRKFIEWIEENQDLL